MTVRHMTGRLKKLCALLERCERFVDVGCDHGYCTKYMLESGLCNSAVISDVSAKSLSKAEKLLDKYIAAGICTPVCCDGLSDVEPGDDFVLIAGMGGEEILKILKEAYIPRAFLFQPMKNARQLREFLLENGCSIEYDGIFAEKRAGAKKYYFAIKGRASGGHGNSYTPAQLAFGRDSLGTPELDELIKSELQKNLSYAEGNLSEASRREVEGRISFLKGVLNGETD